MANQAIALQARAPQNSILGPSIQRGAQMSNMMLQQRAAERQAAQAQQAMDIEAAREARAIEMSGPQLDKAKADALAASLDVNSKQAVLVKRDLGVIRSGDINAISNWRERATQLLPEWADILPPAEDIARDRNLQLTIASTIDKIIDKEIASPVATLQLTPDNQAVSVTVGGMRPGGELLNIGREAPATAPRATPTAPMGGPVEETPAPMGGDTRSLSQVISSALETGVMAKTDFDKLLSIAQPESRAKIADWVRSNNIEVMDTPGEMRVSPMSYDGQTPQSEFAVYRGEPMQSRTASLRDAPTMQQTMAQNTGRPLIIKTPTPPGTNVPIERVRQESVARRPSPAEEAARKTAELEAQEAFNERNREAILRRERDKVFAAERAKKDAEFMEGYSGARDRSLSAVDLIGQMIGDLRVENNKLVLPKGGRRPHGGFESVIGAGIPGLRFIPGTQSADFDAKLDQIEGGAFLEAYESLKGTGQITEIEGTKATNAIQRMKRSTSEVEFVRAAREFENIIRRGLERAQKRYSGLTGAPVTGTPTKTKARTPTGSSIPKDIADMYGL